jgi:hypothetical protein
MRRENRCFASLFLSAAMMVPLASLAMPAPQDEHERHEQQERERRVYDPDHRDYHNWDAREEDAYRRWLDERHHAFVDYDRLDRRDQRDYWNWRHQRGEREEHEHEHDRQ